MRSPWSRPITDAEAPRKCDGLLIEDQEDLGEYLNAVQVHLHHGSMSVANAQTRICLATFVTIVGRTPIYLRVVQQQSQLTGVIGGDENSAPPIQQITQDGDNVSFTATMSHGDIQVHWTVELTVKDGTMTGKGHAIRSDGDQWDVDMKVTRNPNGKRGDS